MRWVIAIPILFLSSCSEIVGAESESGTIQNGEIELAYTLDLPGAAERYPAVVMGHGSGAKTRKDYASHARGWVLRGFAVLRYDKHGVGKSSGEFVRSDSPAVNDFIPVLASDMAAAARFLARHPRIDASRLGLTGESQAGWVIPLAATLAPEVDFVVVLSGPTVPLGQVGYFEGLAHEPGAKVEDAAARAEEAARTYADNVGFDPLPALSALAVPGLWVYGALDRNVPVSSCVNRLRELSATGKPFVTVVYPNGDHGLRRDGTRDGIDYWHDVERWLDDTVR